MVTCSFMMNSIAQGLRQTTSCSVSLRKVFLAHRNGAGTAADTSKYTPHSAPSLPRTRRNMPVYTRHNWKQSFYFFLETRTRLTATLRSEERKPDRVFR